MAPVGELACVAAAETERSLAGGPQGDACAISRSQVEQRSEHSGSRSKVRTTFYGPRIKAIDDVSFSARR